MNPSRNKLNKSSPGLLQEKHGMSLPARFSLFSSNTMQKINRSTRQAEQGMPPQPNPTPWQERRVGGKSGASPHALIPFPWQECQGEGTGGTAG